MRYWMATLALLVLAACSKEKEVDPPAELVEFAPSLRVQRAWDTSVGGAEEALRLGLGLGVAEERVYAAGRNGEVAAFDAKTGRPLWRTRTRLPLAGATGTDGRIVAAGSSDGRVVALAADDGRELWRVPVRGEVLAAPAVSARAIVVRTVDGRLHGLDPQDGSGLWLYEQAVPRLTLRGTSRPVIAGDLVIAGFDNGKVVAVSIVDGDLVWETTVAPPRGRTELERLVDIDSPVRVAGQDAYTVAFQGRVAMLALDTGQIWWSREASSYRGLAVDDDSVYVSTADGDVLALSRRTGTEQWRQEGLRRRGLSAPVVVGGAVAVADFQGYVHWLDRATGQFLARAQAGGARVSNTPVVAGDLLVVMNDAGRVTAFRAAPLPESPQRAAQRGPEAAADE